MEPRPWYRKKRYLVPIGLFAGVYSIGLMAGDPTPAPAAEIIAPIVVETTEQLEAIPDPVVEKKEVVAIPVSEPAKTNVEAQTVVPVTVKKEPTLTPSPAKQSCNSNYSGCLKPDASDYDCAGGSGDGPYYTGPVQVIGYDEYKLDRDGDGDACDK